jgi:hypothetical protein
LEYKIIPEMKTLENMLMAKDILVRKLELSKLQLMLVLYGY